MPNGSRAPIIFFSDRPTREYAPSRRDRVDEFRHDPGFLAHGDQMQDRFGIRGRGKDRAALLQFALHGQRVGDVAVVGDGEAAAGELGKQRLDVAQSFAAGRRIAGVADRAVAGQAVETERLVKVSPIRPTWRSMENWLPVKGNDTRGFLAPMLERVQTERDHGGCVFLAENTEHTAFVMEAVGLIVDRVFRPVSSLSRDPVSVMSSDLSLQAGRSDPGRKQSSACGGCVLSRVLQSRCHAAARESSHLHHRAAC
jgi:hypothetical protein